MRLQKEAVAAVERPVVGAGQSIAELEALNAFTKTALSAEEVYLFALRLCDNQVDRDGEFFERAALEQLAPLFVGKTGLFDHTWSAKHQVARIYRTALLHEAGVVPESGEARCYLKGFAYLLRTEQNAPLIAEIEGGIKKEVSVSCAVARRVCSICGQESGGSACAHVPGQFYEGKRCARRLCDPTDAFEWSFVAVPAQRESGVIKALEAKRSGEAFAATDKEALWRLEKEAECGRHYLEALRADVTRLGLLARKEFSGEFLSSLLARLEEGDLLEMKAAFEREAAAHFPLLTQLRYDKVPRGQDTADQVFCI